jgi:hypothetical protein
MSQILVIGDVHQKLDKLKNILTQYPEHDTVFVGDYFDDFDDNIYETSAMAEWLKENVNNPRYTFLMGNHDIHYRVPTQGTFMCSGFAGWKYETINKILSNDDWSKLKYFYNINNIWFSHAGITKFWFEHPVNGVTLENVLRQVKDAEEAILMRKYENTGCLNAADRLRGGRFSRGGLLWNDWRNTECIEGIVQVIGHTPSNKVQTLKDKNGVVSVYNIDTHMQQALLIDTEKNEYNVIDIMA